MESFEHSDRSALVANIKSECADRDVIPTIIGRDIVQFHRVSGGYSKKYESHIVNLIHTVQGTGSPYCVDSEQWSQKIEVHLDNYYSFDCDAIRTVGEYPDENYVASLRVNSCQSGPHSFADALLDDIDRRETRV